MYILPYWLWKRIKLVGIVEINTIVFIYKLAVNLKDDKTKL